MCGPDVEEILVDRFLKSQRLWATVDAFMRNLSIISQVGVVS
jgi:hypothetical protein